jgi:hypothetical protein
VAVYSDNPAGRLHALLTQLRGQDWSERVQVGWAAVLAVGSSEQDLPELARRLAPVYELPVEIEASVARLDPDDYDHDMLLRWRPAVAGVLQATCFPFNPLETVMHKYDGETLAWLEHSNDVLQRRRSEREVKAADAERIEKLVHDLAKEIAEADVDGELRIFLLDHLDSMSRALRDLPVRGVLALQDAYDRAIGSLVRRKDLWVKWEREPGFWKKYERLLTVLALTIGLVTQGAQLPGVLRDAIEGPPAQSPAVVNNELDVDMDVSILPPDGAQEPRP